MSEEYLDLVNENDEVIDSQPRSWVYAQGKYNFRVINVFLKNSYGQLWIPRRTPHKELFPSCLDMSVGGHVSSGESYDETFTREVAEELNWDVNMLSYTVLGHATPRDGLCAYMRVYEIHADEVPPYNPEDFTEYMWLYPSELHQRLADGDISKGDLPILVDLFYSS
ncbi:MAG: NUDIX domain-containing protein [Candidatus Paceibacteria bacterium]